jgi:hypothetical protein
MFLRSSVRAPGAPFVDRVAPATPKLRSKPVILPLLDRAKRVSGTLHLPKFVWPR